MIHGKTILLELPGNSNRCVQVEWDDTAITSGDCTFDIGDRKSLLTRMSLMYGVYSIEQLAKEVLKKDPGKISQLIEGLSHLGDTFQGIAEIVLIEALIPQEEDVKES